MEAYNPEELMDKLFEEGAFGPGFTYYDENNNQFKFKGSPLDRLGTVIFNEGDSAEFGENPDIERWGDDIVEIFKFLKMLREKNFRLLVLRVGCDCSKDSCGVSGLVKVTVIINPERFYMYSMTSVIKSDLIDYYKPQPFIWDPLWETIEIPDECFELYEDTTRHFYKDDCSQCPNTGYTHETLVEELTEQLSKEFQMED